MISWAICGYWEDIANSSSRDKILAAENSGYPYNSLWSPNTIS